MYIAVLCGGRGRKLLVCHDHAFLASIPDTEVSVQEAWSPDKPGELSRPRDGCGEDGQSWGPWALVELLLGEHFLTSSGQQQSSLSFPEQAGPPVAASYLG